MSDKPLPLPPEATFARCPNSACQQTLYLDHLEWVKAKDAEIAALKREVEERTREIVAMNSTLQVSHVEWSSAVKRAETAEALAAELAGVAKAAKPGAEALRMLAGAYSGHMLDASRAMSTCAALDRALAALSPEAKRRLGDTR